MKLLTLILYLKETAIIHNNFALLYILLSGYEITSYSHYRILEVQKGAILYISCIRGGYLTTIQSENIPYAEVYSSV